MPNDQLIDLKIQEPYPGCYANINENLGARAGLEKALTLLMNVMSILMIFYTVLFVFVGIYAILMFPYVINSLPGLIRNFFQLLLTSPTPY